MNIEVDGSLIGVNEQGFIGNPAEWSEGFTRVVADRDGIDLFVDHWELIWYVREYFEEKQAAPTMHNVVRELGKKNTRYHDQKAYEKHIYSLFPTDPCHEVCKLAGLPMPQPDD